ncbi:UNVERIFIED_CONTAM: hypothetical protein GTU68_012598 [Idotea baltica]|nr:hypothetical protein [Idotea baltica]
MANYSTNEFRSGLKVMLDGDPCSIVENEFVKPGKGQAFSRVRIRNLKSGRVWDRTFKSGESIEAADVMDCDMQYLYTDGEYWHFMEPDTFEQHQADEKVVGETAKVAYGNRHSCCQPCIAALRWPLPLRTCRAGNCLIQIQALKVNSSTGGTKLLKL